MEKKKQKEEHKVELFNPDLYKCWLTGNGSKCPDPSKGKPALPTYRICK